MGRGSAARSERCNMALTRQVISPGLLNAQGPVTGTRISTAPGRVTVGTESPLIPATLPLKAGKNSLSEGTGRDVAARRSRLLCHSRLAGTGRGMHPSAPCSWGLRRRVVPPVPARPAPGAAPAHDAEAHPCEGLPRPTARGSALLPRSIPGRSRSSPGHADFPR